jgi:hypothetical protein
MFSLKKEETGYSETLMTIYETTQCYNTGDRSVMETSIIWVYVIMKLGAKTEALILTKLPKDRMRHGLHFCVALWISNFYPHRIKNFHLKVKFLWR